VRAALLSLVATLAVAGCARSGASLAGDAAQALPPPEGSRLLASTPQAFQAACQADLERARAQVVALKGLLPGQQAEAVLAAYDEALGALVAAGSRSSLTSQVHSEPALREAARQCEQQVEAQQVELSQDRGVYEALAAVDVRGAEPATRLWVERALRDFRRAGVDRDEATRARVRALSEEIKRLEQSFDAHIAEDVRRLALEPRELAGLPEDFLRSHPAGADGRVVVTTNYPDYTPVMRYAKSAQVRERLWREYRQRGFPKNQPVLEALVTRRHELATLLGYASWAAYATETKMVGTAEAAVAFLDKVAEVSAQRGEREHAQLLERKRKEQPGATALEPWDFDYYEDLVKAERFGFDSQAVRPWFEYGRVRQGVMEITGALWGVRYVRVEGAPVWHPEVEVYDVLEGERLLGRIYLDMHPREDKYKHAAQFDLVVGQTGKRYPEGVLVCNFDRPGELMTHDDVETFFHEFGHLLHHVLGGQQRWVAQSGVRTEWDFVETPSMLLQQWASEPVVLARFARHVKTGEPLPKDMVEKLRASKGFGKALWARRQAYLSAVSLEFHRRAPGSDLAQVLVEQQQRYSPFKHEYRPGTHFQLSFGHLSGYSAVYYTYLWSLVIAKELEGEFRRQGYLDESTARRYREAILKPGGSRPAAELVKDFLGRPYGFEAYRAYLEEP
jgi:thimet oligopeptidase